MDSRDQRATSTSLMSRRPAQRLGCRPPPAKALSKITRNLDVDFEDVKHLARSRRLDLDLLKARYTEELRPYAIGPPGRHDLTLKLWLDAIREERAAERS
jgi:hypothetical protein